VIAELLIYNQSVRNDWPSEKAGQDQLDDFSADRVQGSGGEEVPRNSHLLNPDTLNPEPSVDSAPTEKETAA
jgi:hypothetical protein